MKLAVVGGGIAGVAAAWTAARRGQATTLIHAGAGASALYSGALDLAPWPRAPEHEPLEAALLELSRELGFVVAAEGGARVAGREGVIRRARGRDAALLDLEPLSGRRVGVVDLERDDWDAALLAAALNASPWAAQTQTRFEVIRAAALKSGAERRISSYDFARLHDDPERARFLGAALAAGGSAVQAFLTGPWLGVETDVASRLRAELGVPVGETLSAPGGPAGARFEHSRAKLLRNAGVQEIRARAVGVSARAGGWALSLGPDEPPLEVDKVILAIGGVAAGGVRMKGALSGSAERSFTLGLEAPVELELDGRPLDASTLFGVDFAMRGLSALERLGISVGEDFEVVGARGLFAAGDCVAGRPRTALAAALQGLEAARAAISRG